MVTALRSGPPPIPPAQPGRAAADVRPQDFARSLPRMDGRSAPGRAEAPRPAPLEAPRPVAAAGTADPARPARPGSILDIRV